MPAVQQPNSPDRMLADLLRRVQVLEATQRVGLSGVRNAWLTATAAATTFATSSSGPYDVGPAGTTYADDRGNTGSGYPQITITNMPARAWVLWECRIADVGAAPVATYRTRAAQVALGINGAFNLTLPRTNRQILNNDNGGNREVIMGSAIRTFTPGSTNTFQLGVLWDDSVPANPTAPTLTDCQIIVLPLSAA